MCGSMVVSPTIEYNNDSQTSILSGPPWCYIQWYVRHRHQINNSSPRELQSAFQNMPSGLVPSNLYSDLRSQWLARLLDSRKNIEIGFSCDDYNFCHIERISIIH